MNDRRLKIINAAMLDVLLRKSGESARKRSNYNLHESGADAIQRYLIGAKIDSYFRPHRHESTFELAIVIRGKFDLLLFDDRAVVTERISLGPDSGNPGFELSPGVWHTWIPMVDDSVFLEVKEGPYDPNAAGVFAPWSPPEGDERVAGFLLKMRSLSAGSGCL